MKRRTVITGASALVASAVVPVGIVKAIPKRPTVDAYDFARGVIGLPPESQAAFAAEIRAMGGPVANELADVIERLAVQGGWVRGAQYDAMLASMIKLQS